MAPEISEFKVDKDGYTEAEKNEFDKLRANQWTRAELFKQKEWIKNERRNNVYAAINGELKLPLMKLASAILNSKGEANEKYTAYAKNFNIKQWEGDGVFVERKKGMSDDAYNKLTANVLGAFLQAGAIECCLQTETLENGGGNKSKAVDGDIRGNTMSALMNIFEDRKLSGRLEDKDFRGGIPSAKFIETMIEEIENPKNTTLTPPVKTEEKKEDTKTTIVTPPVKEKKEDDTKEVEKKKEATPPKVEKKKEVTPPKVEKSKNTTGGLPPVSNEIEGESKKPRNKQIKGETKEEENQRLEQDKKITIPTKENITYNADGSIKISDWDLAPLLPTKENKFLYTRNWHDGVYTIGKDRNIYYINPLTDNKEKFNKSTWEREKFKDQDALLQIDAKTIIAAREFLKKKLAPKEAKNKPINNEKFNYAFKTLKQELDTLVATDKYIKDSLTNDNMYVDLEGKNPNITISIHSNKNTTFKVLDTINQDKFLVNNTINKVRFKQTAQYLIKNYILALHAEQEKQRVKDKKIKEEIEKKQKQEKQKENMEYRYKDIKKEVEKQSFKLADLFKSETENINYLTFFDNQPIKLIEDKNNKNGEIGVFYVMLWYTKTADKVTLPMRNIMTKERGELNTIEFKKELTDQIKKIIEKRYN